MAQNEGGLLCQSPICDATNAAQNTSGFGGIAAVSLATPNVTTLETYKILSSNAAPYTIADFQIMEDIVQEAEDRGREDRLTGRNSGELSLSRILRAYSAVLCRHGITPEEDTHFYCLVLKLSLDSSSDWRGKLRREKLYHAPIAGAQNVSVPSIACKPAEPLAAPFPPKLPKQNAVPIPRTSHTTSPQASIEQSIQREIPRNPQQADIQDMEMHETFITHDASSDLSNDIQPNDNQIFVQEADGSTETLSSKSMEISTPHSPMAAIIRKADIGLVDKKDRHDYARYRMKALAFRRWWDHVYSIQTSRQAHCRAMNSLVKASAFWENHACGRLFSKWRSHMDRTNATAVHFWSSSHQARILREWSTALKRERINNMASLAFQHESLKHKAFRGWHQAARTIRKETLQHRAAMNHWRDRAVDSCFDFWRAAVLEKAEIAEAADEHFQRCRRKAVFRAWFVAMQNKLRLLQCGEKIEALKHENQVVEAWGKWRSRYKENARHRLLLGNALQRMRKNVLYCAFNGWRSKFRYKQEVMVKVLRLKQQFEASKMYCVCQCWQEYATFSAQRRRKARSVIFHMQNRHLHSAFSSWVLQTQFTAALKRKSLAAACKLRNVYLLRSWNGWRDFKLTCKYKRELHMRAVYHLTNRTLYACFAQWRGNASESLALQAKAERVTARMLNFKLSICFTQWIEWIQCHHAKQQLLLRSVQKMRNLRKSAALRHWRECTDARRRIKCSMNKVIAKVKNYTIAWAFSGWKAWTQMKQENQSLIAMSVRRMACGTVSKALNSWREICVRKRVNMLKYEQISMMHGTRVVKSKICDWRHLCGQKMKLRRAVYTMKSKQLACSFRSWKEWSDFRKLSGEKALRCLNVIMNSKKKAAFCTWREWASEQKEINGKIASCVLHMKNLELSRAFSSWVDFTELRKVRHQKMKSALLSFSKLTYRRVWNTWISVIEDRREKGEKLFKAIILWEKAELSKAWRAWVTIHLRKREHEARLHKAMGCWIRLSEAKAFNTWKQYTSYEVAKNNAIDDAHIHYEDNLMRRALTVWKGELKQRHRLQVAARKFLTGVLSCSMKNFLNKWRQEASFQKTKKRCALWAWNHFEQQRCAHVFYHWRIKSERALMMKDAFACAEKSHRCSTQRSALNEWRCWTSYAVSCKSNVQNSREKRRHKELKHGIKAFRNNVERQFKIRSAVAHWQSLTAVKVLRSWQYYTCSMKNLVVSLSGIVEQWRWGWSSTLFLDWRDLVAYKRYKKDEILRAWGYHCRRQVALSFAYWKKWSIQRQSKRRNMKLAQHQYSQVILSEALECWVVFANESATKQAKMAKALLFWSGRELAFSFKCWRQAARELSDSRTCSMHFAETTMVKSFRSWVMFTVEQQERRCKLAKALDMWTNNHIYAAFSFWKCVVVERLEARAKIEWMMCKIEERKKHDAFSVWFIWARNTCELQERCSWILMRWNTCMLQKAFSTWIIFAGTQQDMREKMRKFMQHWLKRSLAVAFNSWVEWSSEKKHYREAFQWIAVRISKRVLVASFLAWRDNVEESRSMRMVMNDVVMKWVMRKCGVALRRWKEWVEKKKEMRFVLEKAVKAMMNRTMRAAFQTWMEWAIKSADNKMKMRKVVETMKQIELSSGFRSWMEYTKFRKDRACVLKSTVKLLRNAKVASAFRSWRAWVPVQREQMCLLNKMVARMSKRELASAFHSWVGGAFYYREMRIKCEMFVTLMIDRTMAGAFRSWRESTEEASFKRARMERVINMMRNHQLGCAFRGWCSWSAAHHEQREKIGAVMYHWKNRILVSAFGTWAEWKVAHRTKRCKLEWAVRKIRNRELHQAFNTWVSSTIASKIIRITFTKITKRIVGAAFRSWVDWVHYRQEHKEKMQRVIYQMRNMCLLKCFNTWVEFTVAERKSADLLAKAVAKLRKRELAAGFATWIEWSKNQREKKELLVVAVNKMRHMCLSSAFSAWVDYSVYQHSQKDIMLAVVLKMVKRLQLAAFNMWKEEVGSRKWQRERFKKAVGAIMNHKMRAGFNTWREWTEQKLTVAWVVARMEKRVVRSAFCAWVGHVDQQMENREKLQLCLRRMQHKVVYSAFVFWTQWAPYKAFWQAQKMIAEQHYRGVCMASVLHSWHENVCGENKAIRFWTSSLCSKVIHSWTVFVSEEQTKKASIAAAINHWNHAMTFAAMSKWKAFLIFCEQNQIAVEVASHHWSRHSRETAFNAWKDFKFAMVEKRKAARKALIHWTRESKAASFATWKARIVQLHYLRGIASRIQNQMLSMGFNAWVVAVTNIKEKAAMVERCVAKWRRIQIEKAYATWKVFLEHQMWKERNTDLAGRKWEHSMLTRGVRSWKEYLGLYAEQIGYVQVLLWRGNIRDLSIAFDALRFNREKNKTRKNAIQHWRNHSVKKSFVKWDAYTQSSQQKKSQILSACGYYTNRRLSHVLHAWQKRARESVKAKSALMFWAVGRLGESFLAWKLYSYRAKAQQEALETAVEHFRIYCLSGAFFCWELYHQDSQSRHQKLSRAVLHWSKRTLGLCFRSWAEHAEWKQWRRYLENLGRQKWSGRLSVDCFYAWRSVVSESKGLYLRLEQTHTMMNRIKSKAAWKCWRLYVELRKACRLVATSFSEKRRYTTQWASWQVWTDYMNRKRKEREAEMQYARTLARRGFKGLLSNMNLARALYAGLDMMENRLIHTAWLGWLNVIDGRYFQMAVVEEKFREQTANCREEVKMFSFAMWWSYTQRMCQAKSLLRRTQGQFMLKGFSGWLSLTRKHRKSMALVLRRQEKRKREIFQEWRVLSGLLREERDGLERLEIVIAESEAPLAGFARYALYRWNNLLLSKAFDCWFYFSRQQVEGRTLTIAAYHLLYNNLARRSFAALRQAVSSQQMTHRAYIYHDNRLLTTSFREWAEATEVMQTRRMAMHKAMMHYTEGLLGRSWEKLKVYSAYRIDLRRREEEGCCHMEKFRLRLVWHAWRSSHLGLQNLYNALMELVEKVETRQLSECFWSWRQLAHRKAYVSFALEDHARKNSFSIMRNCFSFWRALTLKDIDLTKKLKVSLERHQSWVLEMAFTGWRTAVESGIRMRQKNSAALKFLQHRILHSAFVPWQHRTSQKIALCQVALSLMKLSRERMLHLSFIAWRDQIQYDIQLRNWALVLADALTRNKLSSYLQKWSCYTQFMAHTKEVLPPFLRKWRLEHLQLLFDAWRGWSRWQAAKRYGLLFSNSKMLLTAFTSWKVFLRMSKWERAEEFWEKRTLDRVLHEWRASSQESKLESCQQQDANALRDRSLRSKSLRGWRQALASSKELKELLNTASKHYKTVCKTRAFQSLTEYVGYKIAKISTLQGALQVSSSRLLARSFAAWQGSFEEVKLKRMIFARQQAAVRKVVEAGDKIALARQQEAGRGCLRVWQQNVRIAKASRALYAKVCRRESMNALAKWMEYVDGKRLEEVQTSQARFHYHHRHLSLSLRAWWFLSRASAAETQQKNALAHSFHLRRRRASVMNSWLREASLQRARCHALLDVFETMEKVRNHDRLVAAWSCWLCVVAGARQQRRKAEGMYAKKSQRLILEVLSVWANYTSAMKRDLNPRSPFLEPEATRSAQKSVKRLTSLVQRSQTGPRILNLATPETSHSEESPDDGLDSTKWAQGMQQDLPNLSKLYVYKGGSPIDMSNRKKPSRSDSESGIEDVQGESSTDVLVGCMPKRALDPDERLIDSSKPPSTPRRGGSSFLNSPAELPHQGGIVNLQPFRSVGTSEGSREGNPAVVTQQRLNKLGSELEALRRRLDQDFRGGFS